MYLTHFEYDCGLDAPKILAPKNSYIATLAAVWYRIGQKFGEFYQIAKLYSLSIFYYYYQCFNVFAKLYFAKLIILHFC